MAAAASGDVATVISEFLSRKPVASCLLEEHRVDLHQFAPCARGRKVDFQNPGIGSNTKRSQARVGWRRIPLEPYRHCLILARILDCGEKIEIVCQFGGIGQKYMQTVLASLHAERGADQLGCSLSRT